MWLMREKDRAACVAFRKVNGRLSLNFITALNGVFFLYQPQLLSACWLTLTKADSDFLGTRQRHQRRHFRARHHVNSLYG